MALSPVIWAALLPKRTSSALAKFVPVMVTFVPPAASPVAGLTPVTVGGFEVAGPYVTVKLEVAGVAAESVNPEVAAFVL